MGISKKRKSRLVFIEGNKLDRNTSKYTDIMWEELSDQEKSSFKTRVNTVFIVNTLIVISIIYTIYYFTAS